MKEHYHLLLALCLKSDYGINTLILMPQFFFDTKNSGLFLFNSYDYSYLIHIFNNCDTWKTILMLFIH